jgi:hypothetical protein
VEAEVHEAALGCMNGAAPSKGSSGASFTAPTSISGATSPAPRAIARIMPVMMPGIARGRTMRRIVCHLLAPQA